MSAPAAILDMKAFVAGFIRRMGDRMIADLGFLPDDKLKACPMGCARPALDLVAECSGSANMVAEIIAGESPKYPSPEMLQQLYDSVTTREQAVDLLNKSIDTLLIALSAASEERLCEIVTAPWGDSMPVYALAHIAGAHILYHDGQINYIQSCYGDSVNHWRDA